MVEFSVIQSVEDWAKTRSIEEISVFAGLCAARVWPVVVQSTSWTKSNLDLLAARAILTSVVRGVYDTTDVRDASASSAAASVAAASRAASAASRAASAASRASAAASSAAAASRASAASAAASFASASAASFASASAASSAAASVIENDGVAAAMSRPLWPDQTPEDISSAWDTLQKTRGTDPQTWGFWIDWYEGLLAGRTPDWELWHQIALIPNDIWDDGPEAVARAIEDIKARLLILRQPLAEDLISDPDTGQFEAVARPIANSQLLSTTLAQVDDAIDDVLAQTANGLRADSIDIRILKRAIDRYANDPQRVERDMNAVSNSLLHQMAVDDLPASADNMLLQKLTHQVAVGLRGAHPEIAANHQLLQDQALAEISAEKRQLIADAAPVLQAVVAGETKDQMRDDLLVLAQDMRIGAPPLPGVTRFDADSLQRVGNRTAKILIALRSDEKLLDRLEKSTTLRGATIGLTIVETVKLIFSLLG